MLHREKKILAETKKYISEKKEAACLFLFNLVNLSTHIQPNPEYSDNVTPAADTSKKTPHESVLFLTSLNFQKAEAATEKNYNIA